MIPTDIARKNLRRNARDYAAFFACLAFVVVAFYSFAAIYENPQFAREGSSSTKTMFLFIISASIVAVFGLIFTWSATGFFLKRRSKEIATFALFGMRKREIVLILLAENAGIGLAALASGLGAGVLLSRLACLGLAALMRLPVEIRFAPSWKAAVWTTTVFCAILMAASIRSAIAVRKARLIELFSAEGEAEEPPRSSIPGAVAAIALLGAGYGGALSSQWMTVIKLMLPVLAVTIAGTYFLFGSLAPALLRLARRDRAAWLAGPGLVAYTQLGFRLRRNSSMLATIAILQAVAMSSVATATSFYDYGYAGIERDLEFTWEFESPDDGDLYAAVAALRTAGIEPTSAETIELLETKARADFSDKPIEIQLARRSDYARRAAGRKSIEPAVLAAGQAIAVDLNYDGNPTYPWEGREILAELGPGEELALRSVSVDLDPICSFSRAKQLLVLDDASWEIAAAALPPEARREIRGLSIARPRGSAALTEKVSAVLGPRASGLRSFSSAEEGFFEFAGIFLFIGVFLCFLFFLASCALIGFKQLIDARDDGTRFALLRKIGLSAKEARRSVAIQLGVVFALPLLVGLAHTAFAMRMLSRILIVFSVPAVLSVLAAYLSFSWIFYRATLMSYLRTLERGVPKRRE